MRSPERTLADQRGTWLTLNPYRLCMEWCWGEARAGPPARGPRRTPESRPRGGMLQTLGPQNSKTEACSLAAPARGGLEPCLGPSTRPQQGNTQTRCTREGRPRAQQS